jgi:hypothetical protein
MPKKSSRKARQQAKSKDVGEAPETTPYTYSPLPPRHIRMLILGAGGKGTVLCGKIITGEPAELKYCALSYVWGNGGQSASIYIDGRPLPITETLCCALLNLRNKEKGTCIWIDQICINQRSITERNEQVSRMGEIYAKAELVIAWLGESTPATEWIFPALCNVDDSTANLDYTYEFEELKPGKPIYESMIAVLEIRLLSLGRKKPRVFTPEWVTTKAVESILTNTWFQRTWTVQEAALCQHLFLVSGDQQVPWREFSGFLYVFKGDTAVHQGIDNVRRWFCYPNGYLDDAGHELSLYEFVEAFRDRKATDPRDKIYGFFGLWSAKDLEKIAKAANQQDNTVLASRDKTITVDYAKSVERVYIDFTIWHVQTRGDLTPFKTCCVEKAIQKGIKLPSWTTDWSQKPVYDGCDGVIHNPLWGGKLAYTTALKTKAQTSHVLCYPIADTPKDDKTEAHTTLSRIEALLVTGLLFDDIEETVEHEFEGPDDWPAWVKFALTPRTKDQEQYPDRSNRIEALWRTLIIDEDEHDIGKRASSEDGAGFESLVDTSDWNGLKTWSNNHLARAEKRKLFWTGRGYLGISCRHVQAGDKVCILWGGRLPFILRERGPVGLHSKEDETAGETMSHVLIGGECYVHGLADGQGVEIAQKEGLNTEKICII